MKNRPINLLIAIVFGIGIFLLLIFLVSTDVLLGAKAIQAPIKELVINEEGDSTNFDLSSCNVTGDASEFYDISESFETLEQLQQQADFTEYDTVLFNTENDLLISYGPFDMKTAGRVLGYEITQSNPELPQGTDPNNPCGIQNEEGVYPPPLCPPGGCFVVMPTPEQNAHISGLRTVRVGVDPHTSCTQVYLRAYGNHDKAPENDWGWVDCGNNGFILLPESENYTYNYNGQNVSFRVWEGTCDFTNFSSFEEIWLQVRANGAYSAILLTNDFTTPNGGQQCTSDAGCISGECNTINTPNRCEGNDDNNPLFGPFFLPGPQPASCISNWQLECGDCTNSLRHCEWFDRGGRDGRGCDNITTRPSAPYDMACDSQVDATCVSQPDCDAWTPEVCPANGQQTRNCKDLNYCEEPDITRTCTTGDNCEKIWNCGIWSACNLGQQTRECAPKNYCISPQLTQFCSNADTDSTTPPTAIMTIPQKGDKIYGTITLTSKIAGSTKSLDFYLDKDDGTGANINVLIGKGYPLETNQTIWERSWDTTQTPNGNYKLYARVSGPNDYVAISNKVDVEIDNKSFEQIVAPPESTEPDVNKDTDNEGVSDNMEKELGTNINNPDTDNDSINDFEEVIGNSNPVGEGSYDQLVVEGKISQDKATEIKNTLQKIALEEPKLTGTEKPDELEIVKISNVSEKIGQNKVVFQGQGPPNTYLRLYIYSSPIVVVTKTDASGNFTYSLDKNLADGQHEVYVTITDDTGKIQEKSSPLTFFVKRAEAVSEEEYFRGDVNVQSETTETVNTYLWLALALVAAALGLLLVAYLVGRRKTLK
ncbi:MAG: Ig-like domain-containing protein [Patescibacteria group bacterium]|jgi:hypothetical protein